MLESREPSLLPLICAEILLLLVMLLLLLIEFVVGPEEGAVAAGELVLDP